MLFGVPFTNTWNTFIKNSSWKFCSVLLWLSFRPNHESALISIFVAILISYSLIVHIADGKPMSLESSQIYIVSLIFAIDAGIMIFA